MLRALGRWWLLLALSLVSIFFFAGPVSLQLRSVFASAPAHAGGPANHPSPLSSSRSAMSTTTQVPPPDYLTVKAPGDRPTTATVIFLHGLGDSGDGWAPVARQLSRSGALSHIKWLLPNAPETPVTANGGMMMPAWYDIYSFPKDNWFTSGRKEDRAGMLRSRDAIASLIQEQVAAGTPENRIVVGGFSQGAAVTMLVGFTAPPKLAGVAIASGYMPLWEEIKDLANGHAAELPIWWSHGTKDPLIPIQAAESSLSIARAKLGLSNVEPGSNVGIQFQTFPIPHSASEDEIVSLGQWLARVLPQSE